MVNNHLDYKNIILYFMVAIYPIIVIPNPIGYFYMPRYLILCVLSLTAFFLLFREGDLPNHPIFIPLTAFVIFMLISTVLAPDQQTAWLGLFGLIHFIIPGIEPSSATVYASLFTGFSTYFFCIVLFILASKSKKRDTILKLMVYCATFVSFIALLQHYGINIIPHEPHRMNYNSYSTMGNPNFLATYTGFILPVAIINFRKSGSRIWLLCSISIFAGLLVTVTRGVWLSFFLIFIYIFYKSIINRIYLKHLLILTLSFVLVFLILFSSNNNIIAKRFSSIPEQLVSGISLNEEAGSNRMFVWIETIKLIPQYWKFGMGPDHLVYAGIVKGKTVFTKAHNIYLEIAITMGIFSLISYLFFLTYLLFKLRNEHSFVYFNMILLYLIQGLFNIDVVNVLPLFWIVLGLSISNLQEFSISVEKPLET